MPRIDQLWNAKYVGNRAAQCNHGPHRTFRRAQGQRRLGAGATIAKEGPEKKGSNQQDKVQKPTGRPRAPWHINRLHKILAPGCENSTPPCSNALWAVT